MGYSNLHHTEAKWKGATILAVLAEGGGDTIIIPCYHVCRSCSHRTCCAVVLLYPWLLLPLRVSRDIFALKYSTGNFSTFGH